MKTYFINQTFIKIFLLLSGSTIFLLLFEYEGFSSEAFIEPDTAMVRDNSWKPIIEITSGEKEIFPQGRVILKFPRAIFGADIPEEIFLNGIELDHFYAYSIKDEKRNFRLKGRIDQNTVEFIIYDFKQTIEPGESIFFISRPVLSPRAWGTYQVDIEIDRDGKGVLERIEPLPQITVVPRLVVHCQQILSSGLPFPINIYLRGGDVVPPAPSKVHLAIFSEKKTVVDTTLSFNADEKEKEVLIRELLPGGYSLRVYSSAGDYAGYILPLYCSSNNDLNLFWGELHGHTKLSYDGFGAPENYYPYARNISNLDFAAMTEHDFHLELQSWEKVKALAQQFNEPGKFVTFISEEWTSSFGDRNIFFLSDNPTLIKSTDPQFDTPVELYKYLENQDAIIIPHHLMAPFRPADWFFYGGQKEPVIEIYSNHGRSEFYANPNPIASSTPMDQKFSTFCFAGSVKNSSFQDALALDRHYGVIASSDDHTCQPGTRGLAAVFAPSLKREDIFNGIQEKHTYGSTGARMIIIMRAGDYFMGDEITDLGNYRLHVDVVGAAPVKEISLIKNNKTLFTYMGNHDKILESFNYMVSSPDTASSYYVRVLQEDGEMGWSSPIWINPAFPDLFIQKIELLPEDYSNLLSRKFLLSIGNRGKVISPEASVKITTYCESENVSSIPSSWLLSIPRLEPGCFHESELALTSAGFWNVEVIIDEENKILDTNSENNHRRVLLSVPDKPLFSFPNPQTEVSGDNESTLNPLAKTINFPVTQYGHYLFEFEAAAGFHGIDNNSTDLIDDDLNFVLDGINFGFSDEFSWNGRHLLGNTKKIVFDRNLEKGEHYIQFKGDGNPSLKRFCISHVPSKITGFSNDITFNSSACFDDTVIFPVFGLSDQISIFRKKLSSQRMSLTILWSKDLSKISNFRDHLRWFRTVFHIINANYTFQAWRFEEDIDKIQDDKTGNLSIITRATKPCGIQLILEPKLHESSYIITEFDNGGDYFSGKIYLGDKVLASLPVKIPLNITGDNDCNDFMYSEIPVPQAQGSLNMALASDIKYFMFHDILDSMYSVNASFENRLKELTTLLSKSKNPSKALLSELANLYIKASDLDKTIEIITLLGKYGTISGNLELAVGKLYKRFDKNADALIHFNNAISLLPASYEPLLESGKLLISIEAYEEAIAELLSALEKSPQNSEICYFLGEANFHLKNYMDAMHYIEKTKSFGQVNLRSLKLLVRTYMEIWKKFNINHELSEDSIKNNIQENLHEIISIDSEDIWAHYQLGSFYYRTQNFEKAKFHLLKCIKIMPESKYSEKSSELLDKILKQ